MTDQSDNRERPTRPPEALTEPSEPPDAGFLAPEIPRAAPVPRETLKPDPNSFSEQAMKVIIDGMQEIKAARLAFDVSPVLADQTERISKLISVNYNLISEQVRGLVHAIDSVVIRVGQIELKQESSSDRLERMELDMAAVRHQMDRLDTEFQQFKRTPHTP